MQGVPYRSVVDALMCMMVGTLPGLAAAIVILSQFVVDPCPPQWRCLKQVL